MNDNYIIPLLISVSTVITILIFFITLIVLVNKNKQRRSYVEKKELEYQFATELLTTRLEVQEKSLNSVSLEIHDNICQVLGRVKNNIYAITYNIDIDNSVDLLQESTTLLGKSIDDLRNISHMLNPEYIRRIGLEEAIQKELEYLRSFYKIDFKIDLIGDPAEIPKEKEIIMFRIAQEALANVVKHSKATSVHVTLMNEGSFLMIIADNGSGFDMETIKDGNKGIGLINMQQRAKLINGIFDIQSLENTGTTISLKIDT